MDNAVKLVSERTNYLNKDILYLKNTEITEYDIRSAGFNVIKFKKLLPSEEILELDKIDKQERNIRIGKRILKYPNISEEIINTLSEIRGEFVANNSIEERDVLSVKKDAIFLIKKKPTELNFKGFFEFKEKETYTSYCYLNSKEFYYSAKKSIMDVKGIGEKVKEQQDKFLLSDIKKIMASAERLSPEQLFSVLKNYRSKYLSRELPKETYRDVETGTYQMDGYSLDDISDEMLPSVDISQNYINYILPLIKNLI
jgi:hypothetical protein